MGIPTIEDERFNQILLDKISEKKTFETKNRVEELQSQIDLIQGALKKYEHAEQTVLKNRSLRDTQICEYEKAEENIQTLQKRMDAAKVKTEQTTTTLFDKLQLLEKAKNANIIRRLFTGSNKDQIEAEVKLIENRFRISQLELQSLQSELNDYIQKRDSISVGIRELDNEIEPNVDGITALDSLRQRILELNGAAESKRKEISSLQKQVQKSKEIAFNDALVIGATIARASIDPKISKRKFDVLIVDEASMAGTIVKSFFVYWDIEGN